MKEFGYSSAAAIGLLVVTAGLSLAAVIANLPLQRADEIKGSWKPGSDTRIVEAGSATPALSQPIEESFLVSFDPGADLREADFVAMAQQQPQQINSYTIQSEQIVALGDLSPAAGPAQALGPDPASDEFSAALAAADLVPEPFPSRPPREVSAELLERRSVAALQLVSLSLMPSDEPDPAAEPAAEATSPPVVEGRPQLAVAPSQSPLEPAADPSEAPAPSVEPPAGYVVIGSFLRLDAAAAHALKYQDWQPTIVPGQVGDKLYQRVVVGPFSEDDLRDAWERVVTAGVKDAWRLTLDGETDLAVKQLDVLG